MYLTVLVSSNSSLLIGANMIHGVHCVLCAWLQAPGAGVADSLKCTSSHILVISS